MRIKEAGHRRAVRGDADDGCAALARLNIARRQAFGDGRSALALGWLWDGAHAPVCTLFRSFTGAVIPHDSRDGGEQYEQPTRFGNIHFKDSSLVTEAVG